MKDPLLIDLPEELVGEHTLVRPARPGDGTEVFAAVEESRAHLFPWMPWAQTTLTPEDSERHARLTQAKWMTREDLAVRIFDRQTGRYLGGSGLHRIDWAVRSFEIGYWIRKSAEGKGHVTECVKLLAGMAFDLLEANRVYIRCAKENVRSAAVANRCGFVYEGTNRNAIIDAEGKLHDALVFSMIPQEWASLRG